MDSHYTLVGAGPDAEVVDDGNGRQSKMLYRFDLVPPLATAAVASILQHGAEKYGEWNWLTIPAKDHLNHALQHIWAFVLGDKQEGDPIIHARHAVCRLMFWLDRLERDRQDGRKRATTTGS